MARISDSSSRGWGPGGMLATIALGVGALVAVICLFAFMGSWKGTDPGQVCVVKQGGPFDGRGIKEVRQGGEGPQTIGIWNHQYCFPSNQRNYIVSSDPNAPGDSKVVDFVEVQTKDAQTVRVNGQALFTLNTKPDVVKDFYRKFGTRTFEGHHPYEGGEGWDSFLKIQFRPILDNALREAIGSFDCTQLNNSCQYVVQAQEAAKGNVQKVDTGFNLTQAQTQIESTIAKDLNDTLGGEFFCTKQTPFCPQGIKWRFSGSGQGGAIAFKPGIESQIEAAQSKQTQVAVAKLDANRRTEAAKGDTAVADQQALQIKSKAKAYSDNPQQAEIDKLKALCGDAGCQNLQVLGGNATKLLSTGK